MSQFWGTHLNRLDAKGRISVPSAFRTALRARTADGEPTAMVVRQSHKHPCIEGWPVDSFEALGTTLDQMDTFSEDQEDLATSLYSDAVRMETDKEGRISLPGEMIAYADLKDMAAFMGMGRIFQIWEPAAGAHRKKMAAESARHRTLTLPGTRVP